MNPNSPGPDPCVEVFVGPTAHGLPARLLGQWRVRVHPPARRGSIHALVTAGPPGRIALVDGRYDDVPAVGHRELLDALAAGWHVTGLGSIGALRAVELRGYGMHGYGRAFEYLTATGAPDDEVALLHGPAPDYRPVSEALVDLRAFADHLTVAGVLDADEATAVIVDLGAVWFGERTLPAFCQSVADVAGSSAAAAVRERLPLLPQLRIKTRDLRDYLTEHPWTPPPMSSLSYPGTAAAGPSSTPASTDSAC
ncbi:TfuA-like protein [Streptomyces sp. NBC_01304]|uniref:TfuA-like protein n=1 Tax=Streptomyces sp. NBC_01304 TaxID=2903818 RepID=UPI002E161658|nr:TfuA domain-containing protein [Streptomyces sp. NBC_01304]